MKTKMDDQHTGQLQVYAVAVQRSHRHRLVLRSIHNSPNPPPGFLNRPATWPQLVFPPYLMGLCRLCESLAISLHSRRVCTIICTKWYHTWWPSLIAIKFTYFQCIRITNITFLFMLPQLKMCIQAQQLDYLLLFTLFIFNTCCFSYFENKKKAVMTLLLWQ